MFQYATSRAIAIQQSAELVLDKWSGFLRDRQYRRHYELAPFPIQARPAKPLECLPIWLYRLDNRLRTQRPELFSQRPYGMFIVETARRYFPEVLTYTLPKTTWIFGYWQSPRYFEQFASEIRTELTPPVPTAKRFLDIGQKMHEQESIAIGIRLYEETSNPTLHARNGRIKSIVDINQVVDRLLSEISDPHIYVFCTHHHSQLLSELRHSYKTTFVTPDNGYSSTIDTLWLLSQCRHHIITNSSFYWWGAWLSKGVFAEKKQYIFAADNFINSDCLIKEWQNF